MTTTALFLGSARRRRVVVHCGVLQLADVLDVSDDHVFHRTRAHRRPAIATSPRRPASLGPQHDAARYGRARPISTGTRRRELSIDICHPRPNCSKTAAPRCCCRSTGQTDRQTVHGRSPLQAGSVHNQTRRHDAVLPHELSAANSRDKMVRPCNEL